MNEKAQPLGELFDVENGTTAESWGSGLHKVLVAYVEIPHSGIGFKFCICSESIPLCEGEAPDFVTDEDKAEAQLRFLCANSSNAHPVS